MTKVVELIEAAKKAIGAEADNALAEKIGVTRQHINNYRKERCAPEPYVVLRLAVLANWDPAQTVAEIAAEREKHPERRQWLENFRTAACWAAMALVTTFVTAPETSHAASTAYDVSKVGNKNYRGFLCRIFSTLANRLTSMWRAVAPPLHFAGW